MISRKCNILHIFLSFLYHTDGENIDLFALSSLCREYQVDWLGNKIRMYLNGVTLANNANGKKKTRLFLRYSTFNFRRNLREENLAIDRF